MSRTSSFTQIPAEPKTLTNEMNCIPENKLFKFVFSNRIA